MKKIVLFVFVLGLSFALMSNSGGRAAASNAGSTNAPGEGFCQGCHSSGAFNPSIALDIFEENSSTPATDYLPGVTYDVKVTVSAGNGTPSGYGFQMVSLLPNETSVDTWSLPSGNAQISTSSSTNRQYLEHLGLSATNEFTGKWTAPASGSGDITFYVAGIAANGTGSSAGDGAAGNTLVFSEAATSTLANPQLPVEVKIFPNPVATTLNVSAFGETSGTHTLSIVDMNGRTVFNKNIDWQVGINQEEINVANLASGNYILNIQQDGKMINKTFVKR